jgi:hypothetical protein
MISSSTKTKSLLNALKQLGFLSNFTLIKELITPLKSSETRLQDDLFGREELKHYEELLSSRGEKNLFRSWPFSLLGESLNWGGG